MKICATIFGVLTLLGMIAVADAAQEPVRLSIEQSAESDVTASVSFAASPGTVYRLLESHDLKVWNAHQTGVASTQRVSIAILAAAATRSFFRVTLIPIQPLESMVWIEPGEFVMGSPPDEEGRFLDKEEPQTRVTLTRGYWISQDEVTQAEFEAALGFNPSLFPGAPGIRLQRASSLSAADWQDVPGSEGASHLELSPPNRVAFFRLLKR